MYCDAYLFDFVPYSAIPRPDTIQEYTATLERQPHANNTMSCTAMPPARPLCTYDAIRCAPYYLAAMSSRGDEILSVLYYNCDLVLVLHIAMVILPIFCDAIPPYMLY